MCDMLGISTSRPSLPDRRLFRLLFQRGKYNPDGWGVAWYRGKKAMVAKSPRQASSATADQFLKQHGKALSPIFIAHLRGASVGQIICENTHPFHRILSRGGKEYTFAHNGHLDHHHLLSVGRFKPYGHTDSERLFCHLLHLFEQRKIKRWTLSNMKWLESTLRRLNKDGQRQKKKYGKLNVLLSDGEHLFFYHDINGFNSYWTLQQPQRSSKPAFFAVSMCKLTRENWKRAKKGKLAAIKKGKQAYP